MRDVRGDRRAIAGDVGQRPGAAAREPADRARGSSRSSGYGSVVAIVAARGRRASDPRRASSGTYAVEQLRDVGRLPDRARTRGASRDATRAAPRTRVSVHVPRQVAIASPTTVVRVDAGRLQRRVVTGRRRRCIAVPTSVRSTLVNAAVEAGARHERYAPRQRRPRVRVDPPWSSTTPGSPSAMPSLSRSAIVRRRPRELRRRRARARCRPRTSAAAEQLAERPRRDERGARIGSDFERAAPHEVGRRRDRALPRLAAVQPDERARFDARASSCRGAGCASIMPPVDARSRAVKPPAMHVDPSRNTSGMRVSAAPVRMPSAGAPSTVQRFSSPVAPAKSARPRRDWRPARSARRCRASRRRPADATGSSPAATSTASTTSASRRVDRSRPTQPNAGAVGAVGSASSVFAVDFCVKPNASADRRRVRSSRKPQPRSKTTTTRTPRR